MKSRYVILLGLVVLLVLVAGCNEDRTVEPHSAMPPTYLRCQGESCNEVVAPNGVFTNVNQIVDCDYKEVKNLNPKNQSEGVITSWIACDNQTYHYEQLVSKSGKQFWLKSEGVSV